MWLKLQSVLLLRSRGYRDRIPSGRLSPAHERVITHFGQIAIELLCCMSVVHHTWVLLVLRGVRGPFCVWGHACPGQRLPAGMLGISVRPTPRMYVPKLICCTSCDRI